MSVITISRQIGSHGSEIGRKVADLLGYHLVDKKVLEKIFVDYGIINFEKMYESKPGLWERVEDMHLGLSDFLKRVLMAVAHRGNVVIVGRGSFAVLQGYDNVLNVKIKAPLRERAKLLMDKLSSPDLHAAERFARENDKARKGFVSSYFGVDNDDLKFFDLILDTGRMPVDTAVKLIVDAAEAIEAGIDEEKGFVKTEAVDVDSILIKEVEKVLV